MAETLLIVFVVCILIGMPISIAMGVGALAAAVFYPALNPIIIPTRFVGLLVEFLSAAIGTPVHSCGQHRGARRGSPRAHRPRHRAGRPLPRRASPTSMYWTACSSAAFRARRWPTSRRSARF